MRRRRAKARPPPRSLTREFNGREDEKTRRMKRKKRKRARRQGALARVTLIYLCVIRGSFSHDSHTHVTRVAMGTERRFKSFRIHDTTNANKSSASYVGES